MDKEHRMLEARILQRQGKTQVEIAQALGVCERTVRNHLKYPPAPRKKPKRRSRLDPFRAQIRAILEAEPSYNGQLIYERIQRMGYAGRISVMKDFVASVRRELAQQAVIRFETEPGRQAQVDWKEFGLQTVDGELKKLYAFVMVLGYSRKPFVWFTTRMDQATLLACHVLAFLFFGGVPREILYDNMRTAFAPDGEGFWRPTRRLLAFAAHYGFTPLRCRVRRPETKGKVERAIGYLGDNFWPRMEGRDLSLSQLNHDVLGWIADISARELRDFGESREERFRREGVSPLPAVPFDVRESIPLMVSREGRVTFKTNRYSVPARFIGTTISLLIHPLSQEAELAFPEGQSRRFLLAPDGERRSIDFPGDRETLLRRWNRDREFVARLRRPKGRVALDLEVEVRPVSVYEALSWAQDASAGGQA